MGESDVIVGIDLGTTNSLIGVVDSGFPILLAANLVLHARVALFHGVGHHLKPYAITCELPTSNFQLSTSIFPLPKFNVRSSWSSNLLLPSHVPLDARHFSLSPFDVRRWMLKVERSSLLPAADA